MDYAGFSVPYYNIPSNNRELQPTKNVTLFLFYYNIPSNNRELQHLRYHTLDKLYYNIPSNNRELQPPSVSYVPLFIITYQVITGNYSMNGNAWKQRRIITYQVITGNYSAARFFCLQCRIITYQVITGNYSDYFKCKHGTQL